MRTVFGSTGRIAGGVEAVCQDIPRATPAAGQDAPVGRRVVLVGATGVFGGRLAAMLARMPELDLVLAARRVEPLIRMAEALRANGASARLSVATVDRDRPEALAALRPWAVVDAAGPFQDSDYTLAIAAVRAGAHVVDLADGRAYLAGFAEAVSAEAVRAGAVAITGASSTPALSHAAADWLSADWRQIDDVTVAISPGARTPAGLSVVKAILSFVGLPVRVFRDGGWRNVPGWSGLRRLDMPGLGRRWMSICDTPDLDLLPQRLAPRRNALVLAGLELGMLHVSLAALGWLVRVRLVASLRPAARPAQVVAGLLRSFGSDRGGMVVDLKGLDADGLPIRARWALWAEANAGPNTPAAPAVALIRALLDHRAGLPGAMPSPGLVTLDEIMAELDGFPIATRVDESHLGHPALFRRLLGRRFAGLPAAVRKIHGGEAPALFTGRAVARAGRGLPGRILRRLLGLPPSGHCDVTVEIVPDAGGETWTRQFGASRFASRLVDTVRLGIFEEQFGPLRFAFLLEPDPRGVVWRSVGWSLLGLPLPRKLAPRMRARAEAAGERYRFRVAVGHPWMGLLFAYRGEIG